MAHFSKVSETLKDLPVAKVAGDVVASVMAGKATVLAAPTGSGKSMMVPAQLADAANEQVVVLVPRRFLAIDAASNVANMAGSPLGTDVGYAVGEMSGEKSRFSPNTKLLFVTYGYAISSGLINRAQNIVLDEVHEAAEDISLARAILYGRKKNDPALRLLEMSATVDASRQAGYWKPIADTQVHTVAGQTLACEERRQTPGKDGSSIAQTAVDLIKNEQRKGIAVFCSGIKDVEKNVDELQQKVKAAGLTHVEVAQIYGGTPADERNKARANPKPGGAKILVGTNVIESGVNLRWLDAGISDGLGKIPYDRHDTGAAALVQEHLPQWRVVQQRGRINRDPAETGFDSGIFILHSNKEMEHRPQQATPELERRALTNIGFRAAALGHAPDALNFDVKITAERWQEAKADLLRLGLIHEDWTLTDDGAYVARLPLSPETGAMLCEARRMDVANARSNDATARKSPKLLGEAIMMAALVEHGNLRENYQRGHGFEGKSDIHGGSDVLDGLKAYRQLEASPVARILADAPNILATGDTDRIAVLEPARAKLKELCAPLNVSYSDFTDTMALVNEIRDRHPDKKSIAVDKGPIDTTRYPALKRVLLNGHVNRLFQLEAAGEGAPTYRDLLRDVGRRTRQDGARFHGYGISETSVLQGAQRSSLTPFVVGVLREFPNRSGEPRTLIDQPTSIPAEVFLEWAAEHEPPLIDKLGDAQGNELTARYAGRASFALALPKRSPSVALDVEKLRASASETRWEETVAGSSGATRQRH